MDFCENALEVSFESWGSQKETLAVLLFKCQRCFGCIFGPLLTQLLVFLNLVGIYHFYNLLKEDLHFPR